MKDRNPSLILYIAATILVLVAKVFDDEVLMLITKPMVVPAIYYYYLQTKTRDVNVVFSVAVWLFFIADMITLLYGPGGILYVMGCGIASYLLLSYFAMTDAVVPRLSVVNAAFLVALTAVLGYWLYTILSMNIETINAHYTFYLAYGIVLVLLVAVSAFNFLSRSTPVYLNLCLMSLCMLISDLFYSINKFVIEIALLDHLNLFAQFVSYYFMVRYFVDRRSSVSETFEQWKQN